MRNHILMSTAALLALSTSPAFAQGGPAKGSDETATRLDEIVVTAQKREENIQTVPLSIMSVSGEALNRSGINDPTALQKLVPTLQINNTLFGSGVVIRIRGFGSAANTAVDSDVASYVDGAYVPRPGALLTSFLDVKNQHQRAFNHRTLARADCGSGTFWNGHRFCGDQPALRRTVRRPPRDQGIAHRRDVQEPV
jgi:hypothetical protein